MSEHNHTTPPAHGVHAVHHADMPEEHPERHEHSDVSVRGIWITVGAVIMTALIVHVLIYFVFFAYENAQAEQDEAERRSAITDSVDGPPREVPRLQGIPHFNDDTPAVDQMKTEAENRRLLNSYARTPDGRVRIPINRAMDIALEQNLFPARDGRGMGGNGATTQSTSQPAGGARASQ